MLSIVLIGLSLSMDAFAISLTIGLAQGRFRPGKALRPGLYFGFFQFLMPLLGCFLGSTVSGLLHRFGPYVSFILLAGIGGKMLWESRHEEAEGCGADPGTAKLLALAVATSIDALAVGVSFAFMEDLALVPACAVIGVVTFLVCVAGVWLGSRVPGIRGAAAEALGGCVLIAIGVKLLLEGIL